MKLNVLGGFFVLSVSELLMGEVDSSTLLSLLPTEKSRVSFSTVHSSPHRNKSVVFDAHPCLV